MSKEEIERIAIEYSDRINHEGETSFSIAEAVVYGYNLADQQTKHLTEQLAEKEKELSEVKEIAFTFYDAIDYTPHYIIELYDKLSIPLK